MQSIKEHFSFKYVFVKLVHNTRLINLIMYIYTHYSPLLFSHLFLSHFFFLFS